MLVEVTRHAEDRYRQRVRGTLEARAEIATRVSRAYAQGRVEEGPKHEVLVRDRELPGLIFVCRADGASLVVITLWEDDDTAARVPRRFTDALRPTDDHVADGPKDR